MPLFVVPTSKARTSLRMDPWYGLRVVMLILYIRSLQVAPYIVHSTLDPGAHDSGVGCYLDAEINM